MKLSQWKSLGNESVIYKITNLINGKIYIGHAKNLKKRMYAHFRDLTKKTKNHHSIYFQRAYDKYGDDAFKIEIIEFCPNFTRQELEEREDYYFNIFRPWDSNVGYNISKNTKGGGGEWTEERRIRNIKGLQEAHRPKSQWFNYQYEFISPLQKVVKGENLFIFCEENNLDRKTMWDLIAGKIKHHKGWRLPQTPPVYSFFSQLKKINTGEIFDVLSASEFSKQCGISAREIQSLIDGCSIITSGFFLFKKYRVFVGLDINYIKNNLNQMEIVFDGSSILEEDIKIKEKFPHWDMKTLFFLNPNYEKVEVKEPLISFAKKINMPYKTLVGLNREEIKEAHGWLKYPNRYFDIYKIRNDDLNQEELIRIGRLTELERKYGLDRHRISDLIKGKRSIFKNWYIKEIIPHV